MLAEFAKQSRASADSELPMQVQASSLFFFVIIVRQNLPTAGGTMDISIWVSLSGGLLDV